MSLFDKALGYETASRDRNRDRKQYNQEINRLNQQQRKVVLQLETELDATKQKIKCKDVEIQEQLEIQARNKKLFYQQKELLVQYREKNDKLADKVKEQQQVIDNDKRDISEYQERIKRLEMQVSELEVRQK